VVKQLLSDGGDLAVGGFTSGVDTARSAGPSGPSTPLLEGGAQGLAGVLGVARQERQGGERSVGMAAVIREPPGESRRRHRRRAAAGRGWAWRRVGCDGHLRWTGVAGPAGRVGAPIGLVLLLEQATEMVDGGPGQRAGQQRAHASSNRNGSRSNQRRSTVDRISKAVSPRTWPLVVVNRRTLLPGRASVGTSGCAAMLPSERTGTSGPKGVPPSRSLSRHAGGVGSTRAVMCSLVPPGP
jgi:hypothetical protein